MTSILSLACDYFLHEMLNHRKVPLYIWLVNKPHTPCSLFSTTRKTSLWLVGCFFDYPDWRFLCQARLSYSLSQPVWLVSLPKQVTRQAWYQVGWPAKYGHDSVNCRVQWRVIFGWPAEYGRTQLTAESDAELFWVWCSVLQVIESFPSPSPTSLVLILLVIWIYDV